MRLHQAQPSAAARLSVAAFSAGDFCRETFSDGDFSRGDFSRGDKFSTCRIRPSDTTASSEIRTVNSSRGFRPSSCRIRSRVSVPSGFTLVELLVVIGIIAVLAALVTPAVMRAQASARNAAIKAEIDMLHMAIMNYKNEYGSFPPCADTTTNYASTGPAARHLSRIFPRCPDTTGTSPSGQFYGLPALTPATALIAWLSGFTDNPASPLLPLPARKKLFDYDKSRLDTTQLVYFPSGKPGSPFIYINASEYGAPWSLPITYSVGNQSYSLPASTYFAQPANGSYVNAGPFANADTFQILCAGRDEVFGNDDDLSNFWPGTRRDYIDSLKQ